MVWLILILVLAGLFGTVLLLTKRSAKAEVKKEIAEDALEKKRRAEETASKPFVDRPFSRMRDNDDK